MGAEAFAGLTITANILMPLAVDDWGLFGMQPQAMNVPRAVGAALVVADLMRATGRYNAAQGVVATVQGLGAALSGLADGIVADRLGYGAAFVGAARAAGAALGTLWAFMPETRTAQ